ncbi:SDR family oxidoreductase [Microbacterium sp. YY-01]|uniref:SDR family oxidoreductase n=1 Tax=Microbacterium sp. YY-01 TaxID=3421634 RepID=UPI003D178AEC
MRIAVAGGSGKVGAEVVRVAHERGWDTRVLSRSAGVDVRTGAGLAEAVAGCSAVIDVLGVATLNARLAEEFFLTTTKNLLAAEESAGVTHHITLSIVGVDRAPYGYYGAKLAQERAVEASPVAWTLQRTTQFHDFAEQMFHRMGLGVLHPVPRMRTQPVDVHEVAVRLIDAVDNGPVGRARDLAGPHEEDLGTMMRAWARHRGYRALMPRVPLPGAFGRAMRNGDVLPGSDTDIGAVSFAQWLARQPHS